MKSVVLLRALVAASLSLGFAGCGAEEDFADDPGIIANEELEARGEGRRGGRGGPPPGAPGDEVEEADDEDEVALEPPPREPPPANDEADEDDGGDEGQAGGDAPDDRPPPPARGGRRGDGPPPPPPGPGADEDDDDELPPPPPGPGADEDDDELPPPPPGPGADEGDDEEPVDDGPDLVGDDFGDFEQPLAPAPANNPTTAVKVELGRALYWDPVLSGDRDVACATCHHPDFGYADGIPLSVGVGGIGLGPGRRLAPGDAFIGRNAPTVLNTGLNGWVNPNRLPNPNTAPMFWDSRAQSLETQALGPILNGDEMRGDSFSEDEILDEVVFRLNAIPEYVEWFAQAFNVEPEDAVTAEHLAMAIASFERHLSRPDSRFDRGELNALERRGQAAFNRSCARCHAGPMFSDFRLHRIGAPDNPRGNNPDVGAGQFQFRTPTLRNIALTAPYMHGGTEQTLEDAVNFYREPPRRGIGPVERAAPFNNADRDAIVAFLRTLTDDNIDVEVPESVPSGEPVGGFIP